MKRKLRRRLEVLVHRCCPCPISSERRRGVPPFSGCTRQPMPLCRSFLAAAAASSFANLRQERHFSCAFLNIYIISNAPSVFIQYPDSAATTRPVVLAASTRPPLLHRIVFARSVGKVQQFISAATGHSLLASVHLQAAPHREDTLYHFLSLGTIPIISLQQ